MGFGLVKVTYPNDQDVSMILSDVEITFLVLQTTLCYYDIKDALGLDPDHREASKLMLQLEQRAMEYR